MHKLNIHNQGKPVKAWSRDAWDSGPCVSIGVLSPLAPLHFNLGVALSLSPSSNLLHIKDPGGCSNNGVLFYKPI